MNPPEIRITQLIVLPKGDSIFSEFATTVSIDDEAGGEFVVIEQTGSTDSGKVRICANEWPAIRRAIDRMIKACR